MSRRLVIPKAARSEVWKYFGFEADETGKIIEVDKRFGRRFVWCRLCDTQLLFSGNTTNLSGHISRCHKDKICQTERNVPVAIAPKKQNTSYGAARKQTDEPLQDFNESRESYDIQQPKVEMSIDEEIIDDVEQCPENNISEDQEYCLKWKHHHSNQQTMFAKLLERESFCDVTIACEEKLIRAHKLVLSACSSYFETVLSHFEDQTPIIILKDVKYEDMLTLVQFMYKGEVNVVQNHLATFLEIADILKIRGLSDICGESPHESSPLDISEEQQEFSGNGNKHEQGKRPHGDEEIHHQVKIARSSTGMELTPTVTSESAEENTAVTNSSDTHEGIIRLSQFLSSHGRYQDYWKKPWVLKALKAVSDREMSLRRCSELLGVDYNTLYNQYRLTHGCLKEPLCETNPSTSQGYTLNIVNNYSKKKTSGNIIVTRDNSINNFNNLEKDRGARIFLRADKFTSATVLNVKSDSMSNQGLGRSMMNIRMENNGQQYKCEREENSDCHVLETETSKT